MASAESKRSTWLWRLAWVAVLGVACLFCLPAGVLLLVLVMLGRGVGFSPVAEWAVVLGGAWIVAMAMVSSWGFLRCVGWALAVMGYTALADALSPPHAIGSQMAWLAFGGLAGAALGVFGPRGNKVFPFVRRRGGPREGEAGGWHVPPAPQIRLRSLLVLVAAACLLLGLVTRETRWSVQQRRVAATVAAWGGRTSFQRVDSPPPTVLGPLDDLFSRDWLLGKEHRQRLIWVSPGPFVGDDELPLLGLHGLPDLYGLDLGDSQVSDAGLAHLKRVPRLQQVVPRKSVSDIGLEHLSQVKGLESLDLSRTRPSAAGLAHLKKCLSLTRLDLTQSLVGDEHVAQLKEIQGLETLFLDRTAVTDAGLAHIAQLRGLRWLDLSRTKVTDSGLRHLRGHPRLESLYLHDMSITDAGLVHLGEMSGLKYVGLVGTQVTTAGAARLQQARPKLRVDRWAASPAGPSTR